MNRETTSRRRLAPGSRKGGTEGGAAAHVDQGAEVKLVAIDLDGTLLDDGKKIGRRGAEALRGLPGRGVKVIIASARPPRSVRAIYEHLGLDSLQINYNGALIWDEPKKTAVFHRTMAGAVVRKMIEAARKQSGRVVVSCEVLDKWYTDQADHHYVTETGKMFKPDVVAAIETFCDQPITKLMLLGGKGMLDAVEPALVKGFGDAVTMMRLEPELIQVVDKRVSKGTALHIVASHYGVAMKDVMAIGDAPNDVGMLQLAGVAVAMGNAHALVKEQADWIAPTNNAEGVFAALEEFGLVG